MKMAHYYCPIRCFTSPYSTKLPNIGATRSKLGLFPGLLFIEIAYSREVPSNFQRSLAINDVPGRLRDSLSANDHADLADRQIISHQFEPRIFIQESRYGIPPGTTPNQQLIAQHSDSENRSIPAIELSESAGELSIAKGQVFFKGLPTLACLNKDGHFILLRLSHEFADIDIVAAKETLRSPRSKRAQTDGTCKTRHAVDAVRARSLINIQLTYSTAYLRLSRLSKNITFGVAHSLE
jgi:hypothetical protein